MIPSGPSHCFMCGKPLKEPGEEYCSPRCKRIEQETIWRLQRGLELWNAGTASASGSSSDTTTGSN